MIKNKRRIGRFFERKAFMYLKQIFEDVIWLSENNAVSRFDFLVLKNGKSYFVEAKFSSRAKKPLVLDYQRSAEYIIFGHGDGKIEMIHKSQYNNRIFTQVYHQNKNIDWNNKPIGFAILNGYGGFRGLEINPFLCKELSLEEGDFVDIEKAIIIKKGKKRK